MTYLPQDWNTPEWVKKDRVHNWRNYVPEELQEIWDTFCDYQKQVLANTFQEIANREEWD